MSPIAAMKTLLKNGTVLIHQENDNVEAQRVDILIEGSIIVDIASKISTSADGEVLDCTDKIVSPGFIDTHHHVWQSLLKGRHADQTLLDYLPEGNMTSGLHDADEIFIGQIAGWLEMIDCGTTSVVDFAHLNISPEHSKTECLTSHTDDRAIAATSSSGIRSVFCYCPTPRTKTWSPYALEPNTLGGHVLPTFDALAAQAPWADGRGALGFAFDKFHYLPKERLDSLMAKVREHKIGVITFHYLFAPIHGSASIPAQLHEVGILDDRFLVAHSSNLIQEDADLYKQLNVHVSSAPSSELQMSMGIPVAAFRDDLGKELPRCCSLGVDCHSVTSSFIPYEARLGLQSARAVYGEEFLKRGKQSRSVHYTVEEAFNLATIRGARAAKMAKKTGSIAVGKAADLVIFSATSPSMLAAAQHDPVAAMILHSTPADVETVIVDGIVRKRDGKLLDVTLEVADKEEAGVEKATWSWKDVAAEVLKRQKIMELISERFRIT